LTAAAAQAQGVPPNVIEEIQQILQGTRGAAPQGTDQQQPATIQTPFGPIANPRAGQATQPNASTLDLLSLFQAPGQRSGGGRGAGTATPFGVVVPQQGGIRVGGAWWTNPALIQRLGLTDDQRAKLDRAFENHRQKIVLSTAVLEKEEAQLARLLEAETIDRSAVFTQIDRVTQARGEMERANSAMTLEMREQLTRAQWMQLQSPVQRVRVGGNVIAANLLSQVDPVYPESAKQAGMQGVVVLEAEISREGIVDNLTVVSGNPPLTQAAIDAVRQWRYKPTLLNGEAVPVVTTITVNFSLSGGARGERGAAPPAPQSRPTPDRGHNEACFTNSASIWSSKHRHKDTRHKARAIFFYRAPFVRAMSLCLLKNCPGRFVSACA
jgi:TonB family protein